MTAQNKIHKEIIEKLNGIPIIDAHTHLNASHLSARGLADILLYHMVISDLYSAGCPNGARLSDDPDEKEKTRRIEEAIPYLKHIQNTSCYWQMRTILAELYQWTEPITLTNWRQIDEVIRRKSEDAKWPRLIFKLANVEKANTELCLQADGDYDDILFYALEWAFFTRNQWGVFDAPLYELEYAWQFDAPQRPLPVTTGKRQFVKSVETVADVKEAMAHYCNVIPYDKIDSTAQHVSTDINYLTVTDEQMQKALDNRSNAGPAELNIYASYLFEALLNEFENGHSDKPFQFSFGAEPLPFETDSRLCQVTIKQIAAVISRHPKINFHCFLSSKHANQSMCTLARELPNLYLSGYWWHNFFPCHIAQILDERLDMLPTNKQIGFFSDAHCVDWMYVKLKLVRSELANALSKRIQRGQYTIDTAIEVASRILNQSPKQMFQD
jgi:glucuronate isomerase